MALVAHVGAAWLLEQRQRRAAIAMLLPFVIVATRLAYAVIAQPRP